MDISTVPREWIFEKYCRLSEKLQGQDVKIKSLFNPSERTPSMCIYYAKDKSAYKYKDFSTSRGGDAVDLVKNLFDLSSRYEAVVKIIEDYNEFVLHNNGGYDIASFKKYSKYQVSLIEKRDWNTLDSKYWTQFSINSKLLEHYNVKPLTMYEMEKDDPHGAQKLRIEGNYIYGYFREDGTLYKIYQPKVKQKKFLKVKNYVQGTDQRTNSDKLFICSSLKDGMCLKRMFPAFDIIAPDSENTMIKKDVLEAIINDYSIVYLIFDNDEAGEISTNKYAALYPSIKTLRLDLEKDVADAIKTYGIRHVHSELSKLLK